jgi:hypothetical protein
MDMDTIEKLAALAKTIIAVVGAVGGWVVAGFQAWSKHREKQREKKQRKIDKVDALLNMYGELCQLYGLFAREGGHIVWSENGEFVGREGYSAQPEPRFARAIAALEQTDIEGVIAQKILQIRLMSAEVGDIISELDPTGTMGEQLSVLYYKTTQAIEFWIEHKDTLQLVDALQEATRTRRELRSNLNNIR